MRLLSDAAGSAAVRFAIRAKVTIAALGLALVAPLGSATATSLETLPVLAEVGPWPAISKLIGFEGRIWFANSVKGRNHNSADLYSYDPMTGEVRYERHLFSQDAGDPLVAEGLLYWPFEDSRFSLGWGHFMVTDGMDWRFGTIPTARIFHSHSMAAEPERLIAATSAWRAGLQVSTDGGLTWRELYDHPTPEGRVSRIIELIRLGPATLAYLTGRHWTGVLRIDGDRVEPLPGWPENRDAAGLAVFEGRLYGLLRTPEGIEVWSSDGQQSQRLGEVRRDWPARDLAAGPGGFWAVTQEPPGGLIWHSKDGMDWQPTYRLEGGTPIELLVHGGRVYAAGFGADGRGRLWGPPAPAPAPRAQANGRLPPKSTGVPNATGWETVAVALDSALSDPDSYARHGGQIKLLARELLQAGAPATWLSQRLEAPLPQHELSLIGGAVQVPAAKLARWTLLWAMADAGRGQVPPDLIAEPWTAPQNPSEKYFEVAPAAIWTAAVIGQRDITTIDRLIERLDRAGDPLWLRGDVVGALTALTGERFGYDIAAWAAWWAETRAGWPH